MKRTKKFASLLLAVVMVFALCSTALADTVGNENTGTYGVAETSNESLTLKKSIVVTNDAGAESKGMNIAYPSITFTYAVSNATPGDAYVKDSNGNKVAVRAGIENGVKISNHAATPVFGLTGNVIFTAGTVQMNANGQEIVQGDLDINIDVTKFISPGVYRYKITDTTTDAALNAAGIARDTTFDPEFVFDVYIVREDLRQWVKDSSTNPPTLTRDITEAEGYDATTNPNPAPYADPTTGSTNTATPAHPENGLVVGGYVLSNIDENDNIDGTKTGTGNESDEENPANAKASGIEDLPVQTVTEDPTESTPVYKRTPSGSDDPDQSTTTTDPAKADKDENGNPIPAYATDPSTGDPTDPKIDETTTSTAPEDKVTRTILDPTNALTAAQLAASDVYYTHNVQLKKIVTGGLGDTTHEFPFKVSVVNIANSGATSPDYLGYTIYDTDGTITYKNNYTENVSENTVTVNDKETLYVYGLSPFATVNYTETNDTSSTYKVTVADKGGDITSNAQFSSGSTTDAVVTNGTVKVYSAVQRIWSGFSVSKNADTGKFGVEKGAATNASVVTYTNNLDQISPTGIALRYAPYLFMLAAAAMFVVLSRKERDADNA